IDIRHVDKIKYARQNSIPDRVDERFIINEIKKEKMKLVLFKYESIMSNYRNQIKKNVQVYFSSKMPIDQLLEGILSYCFLSVYKNILDTIHRDINKINGEFKGIIYGGYEL
ncbi:MAG: hypothetical protein KDK36_04040, partial [Leptospiraceae bacterium]|nr:hypothetical protein [Leptospiraceae bacterium]